MLRTVQDIKDANFIRRKVKICGEKEGTSASHCAFLFISKLRVVHVCVCVCVCVFSTCDMCRFKSDMPDGTLRHGNTNAKTLHL